MGVLYMSADEKTSIFAGADAFFKRFFLCDLSKELVFSRWATGKPQAARESCFPHKDHCGAGLGVLRNRSRLRVILRERERMSEGERLACGF
jgi:hypothetical protein